MGNVQGKDNGDFSRLSLRLLLRNAVVAATAGEQWTRIHQHNLAAGVGLLQNLARARRRRRRRRTE